MTAVSIGLKLAMATIALAAIASPLRLVVATPTARDVTVDYVAAQSPFKIEGSPTYASGQPVLDAAGRPYTRSFAFPKPRLLDNKAGVEPYPAPASRYVRFCGTVQDTARRTVTQRGTPAKRCTFVTSISPMPPTYWVRISTRSHPDCSTGTHQDYLQNDNTPAMTVQLSYRYGRCGSLGPAKTIGEDVDGKGTKGLGCQTYQEGSNLYCKLWTCLDGSHSCKAQPKGP